MRKPRQLGNPRNKAWLAGWDAGVICKRQGDNPYRRRPQARAWERGREAGFRSEAADVRALKNILKSQGH